MFRSARFIILQDKCSRYFREIYISSESDRGVLFLLEKVIFLCAKYMRIDVEKFFDTAIEKVQFYVKMYKILTSRKI